MSYELLVLSGRVGEVQSARREARVRHAAVAVPGYVGHETEVSPHAVVALVSTSPGGGCHGELLRTVTALEVLVCASEAVPRLLAGSDGSAAGAEAGHVRASLTSDGSLALTTDGVAFIPCFWTSTEDMFAASTHLASLVSLGVPAQVDMQGLAEYLALLHPLQQRTLLEGVRALAPGGRVTWRAGTRPAVTADPLFRPEREDPLSDAEVSVAFREVWREVLGDVVLRSSGQRLLQGLSGGLDSRAIADGLATQGVRPLAYTYGTASSREGRTAAEIASRLLLPHLMLPVDPTRRLMSAVETADALDGAHSSAQMYEAWFMDVLRQHGDVVVNGLAGGPVFGDDKATGLTGHAAVEAKIWQRYSAAAAAIEPFLVADTTPAPLRVKQGLSASLSSWDFTYRSDMPVFWKLSNRQVRWGNMLTNTMRRGGLRLEAPFLDRRTLALCARLTPQQRLNGRLYLQLQREHFPATAGVARSDDGNSPNDLSHVYWSGDRSLTRQLAGLALQHPVAGARRAARRATDTAGTQVLQRLGLTGASRRVRAHASVFPADLWVKECPVYRGRLADMLEDAAVVGSPLQSTHVTASAHQLRTATSRTPVALLGNVATAGRWLADYKQRSLQVPA